VKHVVKLPKLGETVDFVVIEVWLVAVGDTIAAGAPLVSVETDKVTTDVPSPLAGVVSELLAQPGEEVRTGGPLCAVTSA
jgi:2-oxoglutarate dehydrogenase E2 component (dihydrolipoamide succinyltransferase)